MEGGGGGRGTMERRVNSILRRQGEGEKGGGSLREGWKGVGSSRDRRRETEVRREKRREERSVRV